MQMFKTTLAAAVMGLAVAAPAAALTTFTVDAGSFVTLTDQSSGGNVCGVTDCGVTATLAAGLVGYSFALEEGESHTFDFIRFEGEGTTGTFIPPIFAFPNDRNFSISAGLAFDPPVASGGSDGNGGAHLLGGWITAGNLSWDEPMPMEITADDGTVFGLSFQQGSSWLIDGDSGFTLSATVELVSEVSAVPLPAGALLMGTALAGFGFARRRKAA